MGEGPTSSNRRGAESIQIFSSEGTYNNEGHNPVYRDPVDRLMSKPKELRTEDVGFEAPKNSDDRYRFDVGPAEKMGRLLFDVYKSVAGKGVSHPSLGPQGAYRGNLNKPKVLFIADQESHTDMFAGRAWTGAMGQKLQTYLKELGLNNAQGKLNTSVIPAEYAIVRTFPVDTLGMTDAQKLIADAYLSAMKELIQAIGAEKIVTIGPDAQKVLVALNISAINLDSNAGNWKAQGSKISAAYTGKFSESELTFIPRLDLPAMSRWWMGTDGDRAARGEGKVETGHYYQVYAPAWSARSRNRLLSPEEKASIAKFPKQ
jgi:uracil-DNA glycosylase